MANSFRSLVGLRGIDNTATGWVNDLPGMSTELVAALSQPSDIFGISNSPDPTSEVWESVHRNAYDRLLNESLMILSEKYDFNPVVMRSVLPVLVNGGERFSDALLGVELSIPFAASSMLEIESLGVFVSAMSVPDVTARVRVLDLNAGVIVAETTRQMHLGYNEIPLSIIWNIRPMVNERLCVLIDADNLTLAEIKSGFESGAGDLLTDATLLMGVNVVSEAPDSYSAISAACYVQVNATVTRLLASLLLRYTIDLRIAYGYLCASLLLTEKMASPNLSVFTLSNLVFTKELQGTLFEDFKRALRPVMRLLSNELSRTMAVTAPEPTPDRVTITYGSYV